LKNWFEKKEKRKEKEREGKNLSNPAHFLPRPIFLPSFFSPPRPRFSDPSYPHGPAKLAAQLSPAAQLPLPLLQQLAGGPHPSGPSPTSSSLSPSTGRGLPRLPGCPAPVRLLHRAIKAPPHSPTAASPLPLPRNRRAPSPPALMASAPPTPRHRLHAPSPAPL
jgi:hypothetical protein